MEDSEIERGDTAHSSDIVGDRFIRTSTCRFLVRFTRLILVSALSSRNTHRLLGRIEWDDPGTFLDESSKEDVSQSGVATEHEPDDDSSKGERCFGFGRYFGFGLFDEGFGEMGEEVGIGFWSF